MKYRYRQEKSILFTLKGVNYIKIISIDIYKYCYSKERNDRFMYSQTKDTAIYDANSKLFENPCF